jgi:hypothetical protein
MPKKVNKSLYEDKHPKTSTKGTGFKDKQKALDTLKHFLKKYIKKAMQNRNIIYQKQAMPMQWHV